MCNFSLEFLNGISQAFDIAHQLLFQENSKECLAIQTLGVRNEWYQYTVAYFTNKSVFVKHKVAPFAAITSGKSNPKHKA
jgi:hypothetical protein